MATPSINIVKGVVRHIIVNPDFLSKSDKDLITRVTKKEENSNKLF